MTDTTESTTDKPTMSDSDDPSVDEQSDSTGITVDVDAEVSVDTDSDAESGSESESVSGSESDSDTESRTRTETEAETETETASKTEESVDTNAEDSTDSDAEADSDDDSDSETERTTDEKTDVEDSVTTAQRFRAVISADTFRDTLESVSALVDECRIHLNNEGWNIRAVDPANVGMVDEALSDEAFESYQAGGGVIGVNLKRLEDIARMADSGDLIQMELNSTTRKLEIEFNGLEYTLALIDPDSIRKEPDIPDLDLPGKVVLEGRVLDRAKKGADMVSDHVALGIEGNAFVVEAEGDTDDVRLELNESDDHIETVESSEDIYSLFSLDYIKDMTKPIGKDASVTVTLGNEFPLNFEYDIANGNGAVINMLAPRIQTD